MRKTPGGPMTRWSALARELGMARSWKTVQARPRRRRRRAVPCSPLAPRRQAVVSAVTRKRTRLPSPPRSEEHTSELQSRRDLVCRLLLEKKKTHANALHPTHNTKKKRD